MTIDRYIRRAMLTLLIVATGSGADASELVNLRDSCPRDWEPLYNEFDLVQDQKAWSQSIGTVDVYDLPDKAEFIRYAAYAIFIADLLPWHDGSSELTSFGDLVQIARHCAAHHYNHYVEMRNQTAVLLAQIEDVDIVGVDTDGDGVNDALDVCANTIVGQSVNIQGCAATQEIGGVYRDSDGDGTLDYADPYPYQSDSQCTGIF